MKKVVYKKTDHDAYLVVYDFISLKNSLLSYLLDSFRSYNCHILIDLIDHETVMLWDKYLEDEYKSFEEVPKLILQRSNYNHIVEQWNQNTKHPAKYLVLVQNKEGLVALEPKDRLNQEDLDFIESEKMEKTKYYTKN